MRVISCNPSKVYWQIPVILGFEKSIQKKKVAEGKTGSKKRVESERDK